MKSHALQKCANTVVTFINQTHSPVKQYQIHSTRLNFHEIMLVNINCILSIQFSTDEVHHQLTCYFLEAPC